MPPLNSANRSTMSRVMTIHKRLNERRGAEDKITAASLAKELEVSRKTIQRDLDYMRDNMRLPIEYIPDEHSLAYNGEVGDLPLLKISEGELVALVMAKAALHRYQGLPFEKQLHGALDKLEAALPSSMEVDFQEMAAVVSFRQPATPVLEMKAYETLAEAAIHHTPVTFDYRKNGEKDYTERTVHPYHLTTVGREWYLVAAYPEKPEQMRNFRLMEVRNVRKQHGTFKVPVGFSAQKYFAGAFGVFVGDNPDRIRIRFRGRSAKVVAAGEWHSTQSIEQESEDCVVLSMTSGGREEIARWLISFGGAAEVLEPQSLAEAVKRQCREVLRVYGPASAETAC